jgi:hypothetical protein
MGKGSLQLLMSVYIDTNCYERMLNNMNIRTTEDAKAHISLSRKYLGQSLQKFDFSQPRKGIDGVKHGLINYEDTK